MTALDFSQLPIVDHHAHPLRARVVTADPIGFQRWFTESTDATVQREHVPHTLLYRTAIRWLAEFLTCEPTVDAVLATRTQYSEKAFTGMLFEDAKIDSLLCDYGYADAETYDHAAMQALAPCPVHPILRLEQVAETLILTQDSFDDMVAAYTGIIANAPADGVVALKSIIAYRTGLAIGPADEATARADFGISKEIAQRQGQVRLDRKGLCDFLLHRALTEAARHRLPLQIHTGFGDADADLRQANPLHLRSVIEQYPSVPLVLLHAGWPYYRELAHLAAIYPNVWLDLSLATPFATAGIPTMMRDVLGMAPFSKVLFATDAFTMPEIYWIAARWGRWGLAQVMGEFVDHGFLLAHEAHQAAADILAGNACRLYQI